MRLLFTNHISKFGVQTLTLQFQCGSMFLKEFPIKNEGMA